MNRIASLLLAALAVLPALSATPANANSGGEQGELRRDRRAGNILPPREIEQDILPRMAGMQYLGPEYDPSAMVYRLKFIKNGKVYFVDVDARTGRVISQSR
ncbi:PepSY domain-containing protein [Novosphingobium gossypii]|uniref:PepSY domain-containing protein n=1 Tax=Novosphingobium gossypii TaxID=1604774 RepID=UPI003D22D3E5